MPRPAARVALTVIREVYVGKDAHGNEVWEWQELPEPRMVFGVAPLRPDVVTSDEASRPYFNKAFLDVYAPADCDLQPFDRIRFGGKVYENQGAVERYTASSFSGAPSGLRMTFERTQG